jgi:signal peptide peptidase SppA
MIPSHAVRYPRLISKLYFSPVMITVPARVALERGLEAFLESGSRQPRMDAGADGPPHRVQRIYERKGSVGIITIDGIIDKHVSLGELECYGGCDLDDVDAAIEAARRDAGVSHVMLDINSPGGSVTGVPETAQRVARLASEKPVTVFSDSMICSAAYYIACQASEIIVTPSTDVGSIGVYMALLDLTRMMEMEGIAMNLIKAGKFKAMGQPWKKLEDAEREIFQSQVDTIYGNFVAAVKAGRPNVDPDAMEGQTFLGEAGIDVGLADAIALGRDEVLAELSEPTLPGA